MKWVNSIFPPLSNFFQCNLFLKLFPVNLLFEVFVSLSIFSTSVYKNNINQKMIAWNKTNVACPHFLQLIQSAPNIYWNTQSDTFLFNIKLFERSIFLLVCEYWCQSTVVQMYGCRMDKVQKARTNESIILCHAKSRETS